MASCKCPKPPGGGGNCGQNQMAICRVIENECIVTCIDIPSNLLKKYQLGTVENQQILQFIRTAVGEEYQPLRARGIKPIRSGTLLSPDGMSVITFKLPQVHKQTIIRKRWKQ